MVDEPRDDLEPEVLTEPTDDPADESGTDAYIDVGTKSPVPAGGTGLVPSDPFRRYMAEARKYPPLTREEEQRLARVYRETGDRDALFRLVTANLLMVVRVAMSFRRAAKNLLDLIQEGNIGLLQAIDRFDPELDVRLPTYAAYWVRAYMVKFLLDNVRLVRVGTTNARRKLLRHLRQEKERLEAEGFEVGPRQLADHFGVSEKDVTEVQAALHAHDVSLDAPRGNDEDRTHGDWLSDSGQPDADEVLARADLQERTERALAVFREDLGERDRVLLDRRLVNDSPLTLQEIGDRFGTSREAVRQAEVRLIKKLREHLTRELGDLGEIEIGTGS
ncbi:MAG: sigma-70 family RNA polymerase sigma factor [Acidobacteriota bacterium]|nr:sigma-70 family RNA polymerase sigma factor [Acidobacteriota bacterium]